MTDNEKLIEEAANERFPIAEDDPTTFGVRATLREGFKAGWSACEKAHTPTDDEREALIQEWANVHQGPGAHAVLLEMLPIGDQMSLALRDALRELAALRHSEVPEPSALEDRFYANWTWEGPFSEGEYQILGQRHIVAVVHQREDLLRILRAIESEPQGEPSDAQAVARILASLDRVPDSDAVTLAKTDVRAALKAAFEAGGEGR